MVTKNNFNLDVNGSNLYCVKYLDKEIKTTKIVILCHGMAEHIDRYDEFAYTLASNGYVVYGFNQLGHKFTSSKDDYGYIGKGFLFYYYSAQAVADFAKKEYQLPIYIFGHSMGSFVATLYASRSKIIDGLILCGSGYVPKATGLFGLTLSRTIGLFRGNRYRSKLMNKLVSDNLGKKFPNSSDWLNSSSEEVSKYISDEYCGGVLTIDFYKNLFKLTLHINKKHNKIPNIPILLVSGKDDPVGNYGKGVIKLYKKLLKKHPNTKMKLFDTLRHEILLEPRKKEVYEEIIKFIN